MSIVTITSAILEDELREHGVQHGVLGLTELDCETIVRSMIQRTAELGTDLKGRQLRLYPNEQT